PNPGLALLTPTTDGSSEMTADPRGLVEAFVTMLNEHDPDLVDRFVAADYINHNVFVPDGREANRRFWASFFTALPDLTATAEDVVASGARVVARFFYRGPRGQH